MFKFHEDYEKGKLVANTLIRIIYIIAFNVYSWYWIYKLIAIKPDSCWEDYLNWFFVTAGMHFFVINYQKILEKDIDQIKVLFKSK
jgi:hypothetical protein